MMGEECSLPQDVSTAELRTQRENDVAPHPFATWVRDALEVAYDHVRSSLKKTASRRKRLYDTKAVNRKFPVGSWVLRYYPPSAQHKLGSPWVGPHQVVRQATGHTVGIQRAKTHYFCSRGRSEVMPRTPGCCVDPRSLHCQIFVCQHCGFSSGIRHGRCDP